MWLITLLIDANEHRHEGRPMDKGEDHVHQPMIGNWDKELEPHEVTS